MAKISTKSVERLSLYRRLLSDQLVQYQKEYIYSYELAELAQITSAQVRRDLMPLKHNGNSRKGYQTKILINEITFFLNGIDTTPTKIILLGVGNLGKAILNYFPEKKNDFEIAAAFDKNLKNVHPSCPVYPIENLENFCKEQQCKIAILTVPGIEAQKMADILVKNGIKSIINFSPVPLKVPRDVYVERIDITSGIEKASYFARPEFCQTS